MRWITVGSSIVKKEAAKWADVGMRSDARIEIPNSILLRADKSSSESAKGSYGANRLTAQGQLQHHRIVTANAASLPPH